MQGMTILWNGAVMDAQKWAILKYGLTITFYEGENPDLCNWEDRMEIEVEECWI